MEAPLNINQEENRINDQTKLTYLDFSIQETPYSSYFTLRKETLRNFNNENANNISSRVTTDTHGSVVISDFQEKIKDQENKNSELEEKYDRLKNDLQDSDEELRTLKKKYEDTKEESKKKDEELTNIKKDFKNLQDEKIKFEKEILSSKQTLYKNYKKELHELKKEYLLEKENYENEKEQLVHFRKKTLEEKRKQKQRDKKEKEKLKGKINSPTREKMKTFLAKTKLMKFHTSEMMKSMKMGHQV